MRIALIASGFVDYSLELASALAGAAEILVLADSRALKRERGGAAPPLGVAVQPFAQSDRLKRWSSVAALGATLARWRPDAVLAHEHAHPHLTALLRIAKRVAPMGLIVHDPEPHPGRDAQFALRHRRESLAQRALADRLFTHGEAGAARLTALCRRPVTPVGHGPILRPVTAPTPARGGARVLMFGRMEAYKGLEVLLQAAHLLHGRGVPLALDVRGEGPELTRLAAGFALLAGCEVRPGHASREALIEALAACDLVVAPYRHASASGVVAAALANARGVVASDVGGLCEMVRPGVNGLSVAPGDPVALATGIAEALPQARRFGESAHALGQGPFAWSRTADAILSVLGGRAGRRAA